MYNISKATGILNARSGSKKWTYDRKIKWIDIDIKILGFYWIAL